MEGLFDKAKFNEESKFEMLPSASMQNPKLAECAMFLRVTTFAETKNVVHDFNIRFVDFFGT